MKTPWVAKGVGIQLLINDKPASLKQPIPLGEFNKNIETIEMAAQYIKLGNGFVSPGIANALATFQLEYK
ncbi:fimbrial protein [Candidatus Regiella endosymbiont of Tuberolachnus salignus]|uniref:fimbrial protein n=1 Tax=Candidatus Regiella endosymbiont of Tuberolachnus salignus TaxID=3077956 RepID=UPI0030D2F272